MFKQNLFASMAVLSLAIPAAAQTGPAATCTLPEIADTAPLDPVAASDLVTVPITVNGAAKHFLLDIGMTRPTEVAPTLQTELGLPDNPKQTELIQFGYSGPGFASYQGIQAPVYDARWGNGGGSLQTQVRVGSFGIGNATGRHLKFKLGEKWEFEGSKSYDGSVSGDFFRNYDVELDFAGKTITWLTPTTCADPNQVVFWAHSGVAVLPVTVAPDGRYQVKAMVRGHAINVEIDTSLPRSVMRRDIADLYVGLKADKDMIAVGDLTDGRHMQVYIHTFPQLIFADGDITALNVPVLIQDYSMRPPLYRTKTVGHREDSERIPDLAIGMDLLKHLHLYVVPGQSKVYVTAAE